MTLPLFPMDPVAFQTDLNAPFQKAKGILIDAFEKVYLQTLLAQTNGNISRAAVRAGMDRMYLHRLMKKHNIKVQRQVGALHSSTIIIDPLTLPLLKTR